mmetsp:Transcript_5480/g.6390  ORF Transcript_5480/g.6390 Transcript_5480/m.6390 type:complete len:441 (+) Transcript_5480:21-1343(+)
MIGKLPLEIQVQLITLEPSSALKHVNSHFYMLYNDMYYEKIVRTFGESIMNIIIKVLPWLKVYIKTLDSFRKVSRNIIASRLELEDITIEKANDDNPFHCMYIKDSWKYIYSLLKNKRLFAEYKDYKIDEPTNYVYNHFVEINRTYLLSYTKSMWLSPGTYNLNIGLILKHGSGLGTTKFEVKYNDEDGKSVLQTFYPPTNINNILPKKQFCLMKLGEISIPKSNKLNEHNKTRKVQVVMEEIGLYLKSGFRIFFIDICQPSLLFNDYDLLYYTIKETDYRYFINIPLKNFYKALNYVQNGGALERLETKQQYGSADPYSIWDQYDKEFLHGYHFNADSKAAMEAINNSDSNKDEQIEFEDLLKYADFYFNNRFKKRLFKFNTVYQRRQFINRFGDFEMDWHECDESEELATEEKDSKNKRVCAYDREGLKWKIPIIGEL